MDREDNFLEEDVVARHRPQTECVDEGHFDIFENPNDDISMCDI